MSERRWQAVPCKQLARRELDGELVVRNARTGSTHLLEPLAGEILHALIESETRMSIPELVSLLRDEGGTEDEWVRAVEAALSEFERLGLAERSQG